MPTRHALLALAIASSLLLASPHLERAAAENSGALLGEPLTTVHADRLALGTTHACVIDSVGALRCWGSPADGALGVPGSAQGQPVDIGGPALAVDAGQFNTCAIRADRALFCWGSGNTTGQPGSGNIGDDETPASVGPLDTGGRGALEVSVGVSHACATFTDFSMRCWGLGPDGALGQGNPNAIGDNETVGSVPAINLGPGRYALAIAAGGSHTCAVLDNGSVRCFGADGLHGLPTANQAIGDNEVPGSVGTVDIGTGRTATAISALGNFTCVVLDDGTIRCGGNRSTANSDEGRTRPSATTKPQGRWRRSVSHSNPI